MSSTLSSSTRSEFAVPCAPPGAHYIANIQLLPAQLLKLAAVQALPELSELYVIWDMDMIPTRHIPLLYLPSAQESAPPASGDNSMQLPTDTGSLTLHGKPLRTVVNIGGFWNRGYGESYESLLQRKCGRLRCHFQPSHSFCLLGPVDTTNDSSSRTQRVHVVVYSEQGQREEIIPRLCASVGCVKLGPHSVQSLEEASWSSTLAINDSTLAMMPCHRLRLLA
jgi:hypothetical protein